MPRLASSGSTESTNTAGTMTARLFPLGRNKADLAIERLPTATARRITSIAPVVSQAAAELSPGTRFPVSCS